jgi:twinkle protein
MDKLALNEAGLWNVVSVPDGAPSKPQDGPLPSADADTKFSYVHACEGLLAAARRVVLATDNDAPVREGGLGGTHPLRARLKASRPRACALAKGCDRSAPTRRSAGRGRAARCLLPPIIAPPP